MSRAELDWPALFVYEEEWLAAPPTQKAKLWQKCPVEPFCDSRLRIADTSLGRGLIAASPVGEGEVLLVCQALVIAPQKDLQAYAVERLRSCHEEEYQNFMCLQGGAREATRASVLDQDLRNWIGPLPRPREGPGREVDAKRVERVLHLNSVTKDVLVHTGAADRNPECGLWLLPSLINHSCQPNVVEQFLGDLLLLRAARALAPGEELLMSYVSTLQPRHVRQKCLQDTFHFSCSCTRCTLEAALLDVSEVQPVLEQLDMLVSSGQTLPEFLNRLEELARHCRQIIAGALLSPPGKALAKSEERLLTASFLPVFMGLAFARKRTGASTKVLEAYSACTALLAEVHQGSMYHLHWTLETALQAQPQADQDESAESAESANERKKLSLDALQCCYKFAAPDRSVCEALAAKAGWPKELVETASPSLDLLREASLGSCTGWKYSVEREQKFICVAIMLPEGLGPTDATLDLAPEEVRVVAAGHPHLVIPLPARVNTDDAAPAKYKRSERKFLLQLPTS
ncbi:SMYD2 [Symbiodinium natans]|uniref:SMYD2 protein n=1 Tax=Symbiodinium natans TaxID=878477 RepID=A0A812UTN4_9DINO|nr:SMYD2 [Symbiodinium natans]